MIDNEKSITETLNQILLLLQSQEERIAALCSSPLYDNKALMALLGIKDRYLKRLRDNGLLGYSRHGDKYWYTQADVDRFLAHCHIEGVAELPLLKLLRIEYFDPKYDFSVLMRIFNSQRLKTWQI